MSVKARAMIVSVSSEAKRVGNGIIDYNTQVVSTVMITDENETEDSIIEQTFLHAGSLV